MNLMQFWLSSIAAFAIMESIGRRYELDGEKRPWMQRLKNSWLRWPFKGLIASIVGPVSLWWIRNEFLPTLSDGPLSIALFVVGSFVSMGIGWTIGKWLTTTDTNVVDENNA